MKDGRYFIIGYAGELIKKGYTPQDAVEHAKEAWKLEQESQAKAEAALDEGSR